MTALEALMKCLILPAEASKVFFAILLILGFFFRKKNISAQVYHFLEKHHRALLLGTIITGFALRLLWIWWSPYSPPAAHTEDHYILHHARDLAEGRGYVNAHGQLTAQRPIGYPIFLSLLFRLWGENLGYIQIVQAVLAVFSIFLVGQIGVLIRGRVCGLIAAAILAFFPTSIFSTPVILDEHLYIPLWLSGILLIISDLKSPKIWKVITAGLLCGLAAHLRTYAFAMGVVVFLLWFLFKKKWRMAFLRAALIQMLIISLAVPWAVRNYKVFGKPVLYTTVIGMALYYGNNPNLQPINPSLAEGGDKGYLEAKNEAEQNEAGKKAAFRWIFAHPVEFIDRAIGRIFYNIGFSSEQWIIADNFTTTRSGRSAPSNQLVNTLAHLDRNFYTVIFLLTVLGLGIFLINDKKNISRERLWCLFLTLGYYLAMVALTLGHRKYRFAIEPLFCIIAAYALIVLFFSRENKSISQNNA